MATLTTRFNGTIPATAKVHPNGMRAILKAMGTFELMAKKILQEVGVDPDSDDFIPLTKEIAALQAIRSKVGDKTLLRVGQQIPSFFPMPPQALANGHVVMSSIDGAYKDAHQGGDVGCYAYEKTGDRSADIVAINPYPCPMDEGLILGFVRLAEKLAAIRHDPAECRDKGGQKCVYHLSW